MADTNSSTGSSPPNECDSLVSKYNLPAFFTPEEWLSLFSITSAIIADVALPVGFPQYPPDQTDVLAFSASIDSNYFRQLLVGILQQLPPASIRGMKFVLGLLSKEGFFPSYILWSKSGALPFYKKTLQERIELLRSWLGGDDWVFFPPLRTFARSILKLTCLTFIRTQAYAAEAGAEEAVLYKAIGLQGAGRKPVPEREIRNIDREGTGGMGDGIYPFEFLDIEHDRTEADILHVTREQLQSSSPENGEDIGPKHMIMTETCDGEEYKVIETDVVIVGSGPGGSVIAKKVAEGYGKCLVVDKGYWYPHSELPLSEKDTPFKLFEGQGFMVRPETENLVLVAGSAWGGGGTVNWSVCLQTQNFVREEWATKHGLKFYLSDWYQEKLDSVFDRLGATLHTKHNHRNATLLEGARKLGYHAQALYQNSGGTQHIDGYCTSGCGGDSSNPEDSDGWGWKLGVAETYLPDAARAGAEFIQGVDVERVVIENGVAKGIKGVWKPKGDGEKQVKVFIRAKKIVISAGSLNSPLLLLRSKVANPNIGLNLTVHPSCITMAVYPEGTKPIRGASTTALVTSFENLDGEGYGARIEATNMLPTFCLTTMPWTDPLEYKLKLLKYPHTDAYIPIIRDKVAGKVYLSPTGKLKVDYTLSEMDRKHLLEGIIAAARIAYVQGATEIYFNDTKIPAFVRPAQDQSDPPPIVKTASSGIIDAAFQSWIDKLRTQGLKAPYTSFNSAHQMGTCRMGTSPATSVVDPSGRVWGVKDLYVADASVLPTATGVNPMVTVMATAECIGEAMMAEMRAQDCLGGEERGRGGSWGKWRVWIVEAAKRRLRGY